MSFPDLGPSHVGQVVMQPREAGAVWIAEKNEGTENWGQRDGDKRMQLPSKKRVDEGRESEGRTRKKDVADAMFEILAQSG